MKDLLESISDVMNPTMPIDEAIDILAPDDGTHTVLTINDLKFTPVFKVVLPAGMKSFTVKKFGKMTYSEASDEISKYAKELEKQKIKYTFSLKTL